MDTIKGHKLTKTERELLSWKEEFRATPNMKNVNEVIKPFMNKRGYRRELNLIEDYINCTDKEILKIISWCNNSEESLSKLGLSLYNDKGEFKSLYELLEELNNIWE